MSFFSNVTNYKETQVQMKKYTKENIFNIMERYDDFKFYSDEEKLIVAYILYNKIKLNIDNSREFEISLYNFIDNMVRPSNEIYIRISKNNPNGLNKMIDYINKKNLTIKNFINTDDEKISEILKMQYNYNDNAPSDEVFTVKMFNIRNNSIISPNKIENLRNLYNEVIYPIIMYYKLKNSNKGSILRIDEGLSSNSKLEQIGKAIEFTLDGIDTNLVYNDIKDRKILVNYGIMKINKNKLYISLPYEMEGKEIRNYYVE